MQIVIFSASIQKRKHINAATCAASENFTNCLITDVTLVHCEVSPSMQCEVSPSMQCLPHAAKKGWQPNCMQQVLR